MPEHDAAGDDGAKKNSPRKKVAAVSGAGKAGVAGVIGGKVAKLQHALSRQEIVWPPKGRPHVGVMPGAWRVEGPFDDTGLLPADCPVRPLGYDGEIFYFIDTSGQVFSTGTSAMGVERVQKLFAGQEDFLYWAWPSWNRTGKAVTGFKAEEARRDLYAACRKRGPWTPTDRVRGRGAWLSGEGRLILHCGEYLYVDGHLEDTGEKGNFFYVRRPTSVIPWPNPVAAEDNPAIEIFNALRSWSMERDDIDVMLTLGGIGVSFMGAALEWRPSIFIVGDPGTGKSELTGKTGLLRAAIGRSLISTTNASEAGLYQIVGHDSLPIAIDELEGEDGIEQAQKIIKMARDAASGSIRIRGGQDHKGVEFQAQSVFWFSAVNPPGLPPASLSRLAIVQLNPLITTTGQAPRLKAAETIGPRLLRRVADNFSDFQRIFEGYRVVLQAHGHASRGQKTFGTLLACAHLLLGDEGMEALGLPFESLDYWGEALAADAVPELENVKPTWLDCLERILTRPIDKFQGGQRTTAAVLIETHLDGDLSGDALKTALGAVDLGIQPTRDGMLLAIPNQSDVLAKHLVDSPYAQKGSTSGSWSWALRRAPPHIAIRDKELNRVTIAGLQRRCTLIHMREVRKWLKEKG